MNAGRGILRAVEGCGSRGQYFREGLGISFEEVER